MRILVIIVALVISACSIVQQSASPEAADYSGHDTRYYELIALSKESASLEVFKALRNVYVDTSHYNPYFGLEHRQSQIMSEALRASNWAECIQQAQNILDTNYISLSAHYGSMVCSYETEDEAKGEYHKYVLDGLVDAMRATGDGMSLESAFYSTSGADLHTYLDLYGLTKVEQALTHYEGKSYDVMTVTDPDTGAELKLYFDITAQWTRGFTEIK
jgi:hypothetical protein